MKKKVVKLQNKTNEGLFELNDNVDRDYNKVQSVHRINSTDEAQTYKKIGYKSRYEKLRPAEYSDDQPNNTSLPIINETTTITGSRPKIKDILSDTGIS